MRVSFEIVLRLDHVEGFAYPKTNLQRECQIEGFKTLKVSAKKLKFWQVKYPTEIQAFGMRIRKLREERGLSQQELADEADINKKTLQKIELGRIATNLEIILALSRALDIELSSIFVNLV